MRVKPILAWAVLRPKDDDIWKAGIDVDTICGTRDFCHEAFVKGKPVFEGARVIRVKISPVTVKKRGRR